MVQDLNKMAYLIDKIFVTVQNEDELIKLVKALKNNR